MTVPKRPWQEPRVRSIADLADACGVACNAGSTAVSGANCANGSQASNKCQLGNTPGRRCQTGLSV